MDVNEMLQTQIASEHDSAENLQKGEWQYRERIKFIRERGIERLGVATSWAWYDDPKRLTFTFSRYKFISKMFAGFERVLEVGCGDGFVSRVVAQAVGSLTCLDFDAEFINDAKERMSDRWPINFLVWDPVEKPVPGNYQGIYALDVLEHIPQSSEDMFIKNIISSLDKTGSLILGIPSLESQAFASPQSREGHVNCKKQAEFLAFMKKYFHSVFMFSMNDETIHTGYSAMAHYLIALCCHKKVD